MPAMCINGKVVGAYDGPSSVNVHGCFRCKSTRNKLGCDEAKSDSDIFDDLDSKLMTKVIGTLAARLDPGEMATVLDALQSANLISKTDVRTVQEAIENKANGETDEGDTDGMAADRAFRAKFPGAAHIGHLPGGAVDEQRTREILARRAPPYQKPTPAALKRSNFASDAIQSFASRYPVASRIKVI